MDLYRYANNDRRGALHYVHEVAGGMLVALCGRQADGMRPLAAAVKHTECRRCAAARAELVEPAAVEAVEEQPAAVEVAEQTSPALYRPAAPRRRGVGHHRRPGTGSSYCGRTLEANPSEAALFTGTCQPCAKGEARERVAAEQTVAELTVDGPTLAERAGMRYALVGTGRRVHYSNNDDTLCGREVTSYTDGLDDRHNSLCARCINAAEQRAYARALAAASPLAAAVVDLAETVEAVDAEREKAAEQRVVIIPCGAAKLDREAPARELYTGSYHRACARAAAALTATGGTVVILSALHGLVPLDRVLAPYEMRMGAPGSVTADVLREQARELGLDRADDVTILAGLSYTAPALAVWPHAATPLAGLPGMGHQLRALAAIADGEQEPAAEEAPALYAPRGLRNLTTGHVLDESTGRAYCGAELAGPNGAAVLTCAACRHVRDHQPADALEADLDAQFARAARAVDAVTHAEETGARVATLADADALYAAQLVTEADATDGTWRGEWIGERTTTTAPTLFDLATEQGALFA
ncbi:DUF6884 domain-containing protein [Streptomyces griseoflavus]|uniref:DUF6884 domain-containing protein n=1 Tax=Streptomyces griseoflavus TaxID=35619 RepID=UPI0034117BF8